MSDDKKKVTPAQQAAQNVAALQAGMQENNQQMAALASALDNATPSSTVPISQVPGALPPSVPVTQPIQVPVAQTVAAPTAPSYSINGISSFPLNTGYESPNQIQGTGTGGPINILGFPTSFGFGESQSMTLVPNQTYNPMLNNLKKVNGKKHINRWSILAQMLGNACDYNSTESQPEGCFFKGTSVLDTCASITDVYSGKCQVSKIMPPPSSALGDNGTSIFCNLDVGTQVKLHLSLARKEFTECSRGMLFTNPKTLNRWFGVLIDPQKPDINRADIQYKFYNVSVAPGLQQLLQLSSSLPGNKNQIAPEYNFLIPSSGVWNGKPCVMKARSDGSYEPYPLWSNGKPTTLVPEQYRTTTKSYYSKFYGEMQDAFRHLFWAMQILMFYVGDQRSGGDIPWGSAHFFSDAELYAVATLELILASKYRDELAKDTANVNDGSQVVYYIEILRFLEGRALTKNEKEDLFINVINKPEESRKHVGDVITWMRTMWRNLPNADAIKNTITNKAIEQRRASIYY